MKRERLTQVVLVIVGLLNLAVIYPLYGDLRHSSWLVEAWIHGVHRDFTDVIIALVIGGVLLALLPAKREALAPGVA